MRDDHDDDELLARALAASEPEVEVPVGFAEGVVQRSLAPRRSPWMRFAAIAASIALVLGGGAVAHARRRIEGSFVVDAGGERPEQHALGARGVAVIEPGTELRFAVGGILGSEPDVIELERGEVFLRIEPGAELWVRTPHGRVRVTGTCLRVAVRGDGEGEGEMGESRVTRAGLFGAGAMSAAMLVMVYEGSVAVSSAEGQPETELAPGEVAAIEGDGHVSRIGGAEGDAPSASTASTRDDDARAATAAAAGGVTLAGVRLEQLRGEVSRLRDILARHQISPETGERDPHARRGIDDDGNTDLTPEEWRTLAERGELRYRLPGGREGGIQDAVAEARDLEGERRARVEQIIREAHEALERDVGQLYVEAAGLDPAGMSLMGMMSEIEDKTEGRLASHIRWQLSQERAGLAASPPISEEMAPYERMLRRVIAFEADLERALSAELGPEEAHALLFTEPHVSAHAFGSRGQP